MMNASKPIPFSLLALLLGGLACMALAGALLAGCASDNPAESTASETESASASESAAEEEPVSKHEMVYLGEAGEVISAADFDGDGLWGFTAGDAAQVVVLHIGEDGIVDAEGNKVAFDELEYGAVAEADFDIVSLSFPGQVSVDGLVLLENGNEAAAQRYAEVLAEMEASLQGSAIDTDSLPAGSPVVIQKD